MPQPVGAGDRVTRRLPQAIDCSNTIFGKAQQVRGQPAFTRRKSLCNPAFSIPCCCSAQTSRTAKLRCPHQRRSSSGVRVASTGAAQLLAVWANSRTAATAASSELGPPPLLAAPAPARASSHCMAPCMTEAQLSGGRCAASAPPHTTASCATCRTGESSSISRGQDCACFFNDLLHTALPARVHCSNGGCPAPRAPPRCHAA